MKISAELVEYAYKKKVAVIVEAANERVISTFICRYNKKNKGLKFKQKRLLIIDPESMETRRVWEVSVVDRPRKPLSDKEVAEMFTKLTSK